MALDSESVWEEQQHDPPAHHPCAPPDELFDISTTIDPSYIISLIRKLLPADASSNRDSVGVNVGVDINQLGNGGRVEESSASLPGDGVPNSPNNRSKSMEIVGNYSEHAKQEGADEESCCRSDQPRMLLGEEAWEEYGCVLWDLAASKTNAEVMIQNLVLEVLLANLLVSQSARVKEICLGIIGNLSCHQALLKHIVSTNGLVETIVGQLFLEDAQCLCEAFRLLTLGFQSCECISWAEALKSEDILCRILWVAENTLNLQLIEKSVGLLLAIIESQSEVHQALLPTLMNLGLPSLMITLVTFEMGKLTSERIPERYPILDIVLRAIEALSAVDGHSQEICTNKKLFMLACDMVKFPDKVEVSSSCVTAAVLIANILSDVTDLVAEISQDFPFLQGLLDIFPFVSDDLEARSALWSIMARLMLHVQESEMSQSSLYLYVSVLVSKSDLIEDDLLNHQLDDSGKGHEATTSCTKSSATTVALRRIISILNQWTASRDSAEESQMAGELDADIVDIHRLLDCCRKYSE